MGKGTEVSSDLVGGSLAILTDNQLSFGDPILLDRVVLHCVFLKRGHFSFDFAQSTEASLGARDLHLVDAAVVVLLLAARSAPFPILGLLVALCFFGRVRRVGLYAVLRLILRFLAGLSTPCVDLWRAEFQGQ